MAPPKENPFSKYFYPGGFAILGVTSVLASNYYARRPYYAGIQRHIALGITGGIIGYYVEKYFQRKWSERDAVVRHYIELHPEDFQDKRRKYKEVFDEWYPVR